MLKKNKSKASDILGNMIGPGRISLALHKRAKETAEKWHSQLQVYC